MNPIRRPVRQPDPPRRNIVPPGLVAVMRDLRRLERQAARAVSFPEEKCQESIDSKPPNAMLPDMATTKNETHAYVGFIRRGIRALAKRGSVDVDDIKAIRDLQADLDAVFLSALQGAKANGYSLAELGDRLGISRQRVHQLLQKDTPPATL